jgi:hypothetical protein
MVVGRTEPPAPKAKKEATSDTGDAVSDVGVECHLGPTYGSTMIVVHQPLNRVPGDGAAVIRDLGERG